MLIALSCTNSKIEPKVESAINSELESNIIAGGTSEETNTLSYNGVEPTLGKDGLTKTAFSFKNPSSYIVSEEYGGKFSVAVAFEISAWFKIDSLPKKSSTPYSLIGKFIADSSALPSEFSLALVNGACNSQTPTFAFFLTEEASAFACEQAVLSKKPAKVGSWVFVEAKWDGHYLMLYQDNVMVAKKERILAVLPYSKLPVYLGKSNVSFAIDDFSLNAEVL